MKRQIKLTSQEQQLEQQAAQHQESLQTSAIEFDSVEKMLRHDAMHTPVPPVIAHRLEASIGPMVPAGRPWWRRWLGK
jgi:hypothetical protein